MRYFLEIAYNGTNYCGWQIQPNAISVQEVLERKMSILLQKEIKVHAAGRTDAGVHAKQLYVHFDYEAQFEGNFIYKINSFLPSDISVIAIHSVVDDAHARFNAIAREYEYLISVKKNVFLEGLSYQLYHAPDILKMNEAASILLKYQDFQCFSRSNTDVKTYFCDINKAYWEREGDLLKFTIQADRFLRNMVRAIVGTLLNIGFGKSTIEDLHNIIASKDRREAGTSAPAHGLYLTKVEYPEDVFLRD
ncbi:tRNA pseudouridine synthase A [Patiriisocius marinistellae]|uniref:tRNA pseudouridine synthase A n=1 Tax=Patiriisocius marinistellae TaxID=2494560 RepID=A0A5J4FX39_9FLAO|nr:tRNA pseudouridine(38-40) synthase TruA [Patiriisocius marinistellae]GEQ85694.1 tRNA pseudouridine synthase A [Patiriisocius marinistellae]